MSWPWEVVERDHELQNPTSAEKIRLVVDYMRLDHRTRVLDVACLPARSHVAAAPPTPSTHPA